MITQFTAENRPLAKFDGDMYRYTWRYRWSSEGGMAAWLMMNPSLASTERSDLTVDRVMHFSRQHGCGGAMVVNLWPLITPKSKELWKAVPDFCAEKIANNREDIATIGAEANLRIAAFGLRAGRKHSAHVRDMIDAFGSDVHCLGVSPDGWPYHPLVRGRYRIPDDRRLKSWQPPQA